MIERLGNTPSIGGQSEYLVESGLGVGLYKGNPVSLQDAGGSEGFLQDLVSQLQTTQVMVALLTIMGLTHY